MRRIFVAALLVLLAVVIAFSQSTDGQDAAGCYIVQQDSQGNYVEISGQRIDVNIPEGCQADKYYAKVEKNGNEYAVAGIYYDEKCEEVCGEDKCKKVTDTDLPDAGSAAEYCKEMCGQDECYFTSDIGVVYKDASCIEACKPKEDIPAFGLDISYAQGTIDAEKMCEAGVSFVYLKASEGVGEKDNKFEENIKKLSELKDNKICFGPYHFIRPDFDNSPEDEANYFCNTIVDAAKQNNIKYCLPPAIDVENMGEISGMIWKGEPTKIGISLEEWIDRFGKELEKCISENKEYFPTYDASDKDKKMAVYSNYPLISRTAGKWGFWLAYWVSSKRIRPDLNPEKHIKSIPVVGTSIWQYGVARAGNKFGASNQNGDVDVDILIVSDGSKARIGTLKDLVDRFKEWGLTLGNTCGKNFKLFKVKGVISTATAPSGGGGGSGGTGKAGDLCTPTFVKSGGDTENCDAFLNKFCDGDCTDDVVPCKIEIGDGVVELSGKPGQNNPIFRVEIASESAHYDTRNSKGCDIGGADDTEDLTSEHNGMLLEAYGCIITDAKKIKQATGGQDEGQAGDGGSSGSGGSGGQGSGSDTPKMVETYWMPQATWRYGKTGQVSLSAVSGLAVGRSARIRPLMLSTSESRYVCDIPGFEKVKYVSVKGAILSYDIIFRIPENVERTEDGRPIIRYRSGSDNFFVPGSDAKFEVTGEVIPVMYKPSLIQTWNDCAVGIKYKGETWYVLSGPSYDKEEGKPHDIQRMVKNIKMYDENKEEITAENLLNTAKCKFPSVKKISSKNAQDLVVFLNDNGKFVKKDNIISADSIEIEDPEFRTIRDGGYVYCAAKLPNPQNYIENYNYYFTDAAEDSFYIVVGHYHEPLAFVGFVESSEDSGEQKGDVAMGGCRIENPEGIDKITALSNIKVYVQRMKDYQYSPDPQPWQHPDPEESDLYIEAGGAVYVKEGSTLKVYDPINLHPPIIEADIQEKKVCLMRVEIDGKERFVEVGVPGDPLKNVDEERVCRSKLLAETSSFKIKDGKKVFLVKVDKTEFSEDEINSLDLGKRVETDRIFAKAGNKMYKKTYYSDDGIRETRQDICLIPAVSTTGVDKHEKYLVETGPLADPDAYIEQRTSQDDKEDVSGKTLDLGNEKVGRSVWIVTRIVKMPDGADTKEKCGSRPIIIFKGWQFPEFAVYEEGKTLTETGIEEKCSKQEGLACKEECNSLICYSKGSTYYQDKDCKVPCGYAETKSPKMEYDKDKKTLTISYEFEGSKVSEKAYTVFALPNDITADKVSANCEFNLYAVMNNKLYYLPKGSGKLISRPSDMPVYIVGLDTGKGSCKIQIKDVGPAGFSESSFKETCISSGESSYCLFANPFIYAKDPPKVEVEYSCTNPNIIYTKGDGTFSMTSAKNFDLTEYPGAVALASSCSITVRKKSEGKYGEGGIELSGIDFPGLIVEGYSGEKISVSKKQDFGSFRNVQAKFKLVAGKLDGKEARFITLGGNKGLHLGLDLEFPKGSKVRFDLDNYGDEIKLLHVSSIYGKSSDYWCGDTGAMYDVGDAIVNGEKWDKIVIFCHGDLGDVKVGSTVGEGDVVYVVGDKGVKGAHLHVEYALAKCKGGGTYSGNNWYCGDPDHKVMNVVNMTDAIYIDPYEILRNGNLKGEGGKVISIQMPNLV